ncbi:hypothetical protein BN1723_011519, partial [Verticillium longisporum]
MSKPEDHPPAYGAGAGPQAPQQAYGGYQSTPPPGHDPNQGYYPPPNGPDMGGQ